MTKHAGGELFVSSCLSLELPNAFLTRHMLERNGYLTRLEPNSSAEERNRMRMGLDYSSHSPDKQVRNTKVMWSIRTKGLRNSRCDTSRTAGIRTKRNN